ncbi:MAG: cytochrome c-550 PedF [Rhodocyclaceae bacterium]|nr:cytochrome c-550 PedF [Rhodocyclaceae bacterium]
MNKRMNARRIVQPMALAAVLLAAGAAFGHGDVTPQPVNTDGLAPIGKEWLPANPYRNNPLAIKIGDSAFNQNCARCHGLEAISGGIAPDLRLLPKGDEGDEIFKPRVINGSVRNGRVYMPRMADYISQEGLWAIRAYLETRHVDDENQ